MPGPMTFVNLGNRPAAIIYVGLQIAQGDKASCEDSGESRESIVNSFIVKAGDLSVRQADPERSTFRVSISEANRKIEGIPIKVCARFSVVTPDNPVDYVTLEVNEDTMRHNSESVSVPVIAPKPEQLARHWRTVFTPEDATGGN
jgi:hypothetical protein